VFIIKPISQFLHLFFKLLRKSFNKFILKQIFVLLSLKLTKLALNAKVEANIYYSLEGNIENVL
jgi:uncharacterized membrane protein YczE